MWSGRRQLATELRLVGRARSLWCNLKGRKHHSASVVHWVAGMRKLAGRQGLLVARGGPPWVAVR